MSKEEIEEKLQAYERAQRRHRVLSPRIAAIPTEEFEMFMQIGREVYREILLKRKETPKEEGGKEAD